MTDYGHTLRFGVSIDPSASDYPEALRLARQADAAGLDLLAVQDHPYQDSHLDAWTLLTQLVAHTDHIAVMGDVLDLQLRPPTLTAKAAASLAVMNGGRVHLGVGGGASAQGVAAMGGRPRSAGDTITFTEEALRIMRRALDGGVVQASSEQHQVAGYRAGPVPPGHVGIWVGGQRPRMLRVMGRVADGWISPLNIYVAPHEVPEKQEIIDEAATTAGRDPRDIRRIYNVLGAIGPFRGGQGLVGPVDEWVETLASWAVDLGFDTFVFWPITDAADQLRLFSDVVVPAVRDRVASLRSARGTALVDAGTEGSRA
ncbi:LLM class flavin-dependent oxidoreductase [Cellulosimicrobium cellulans]|uniref:LLM class flavin-dependent oxidoreductase n=1 Tax=Cellulosimicrobium cellulans TaxID=1710 RepID=UPI0019661878|nr:LLM class flavin-dependent oxidoreductase [Cellulosimicrobium cellulans]MBN0042272.1 LLM class flavin-dependent oxidoreductase [Cellulosimicrobium cellulans]